MTAIITRTWMKTVTAPATFTAGNGTVTFSGTDPAAITAGGETFNDVIVNKSAGHLLFSEDCDPDSITQTAGEIRVTTGKTLTVAGNTSFATSLTGVGGSATLVVGGNNVITGGTITNIDFNVTGTNVAHDCTITGCDASAGVDLTATDNCVDGGGNDASIVFV